ncbi:MAG: undecaprenyldiphospho-muramoylpentapeptide beta-N-acetylglucosaminyltransferase [Chthoniobacterales bacterium]|nr:undecaprenyldiphospho-muramoylpentapeptide beta-N-acetylglucosaminyltransferase [Chthoniobacterales bacterium]
MSEKQLQVVIACGGTGGHLFPGLAVAQELRRRGHEVLLMVSEKEIDTMALRAYPEFRAERLPSIGMPALISPAMVRFLRRVWESMTICLEIYRRFRPSVVLGMGGFTSCPPILAGWRKRIPCLVHESNAIAGKANRLSARFVKRVLLGFEEAKVFFRETECVFTGTPVRDSLEKRMERGEAVKKFGLDVERKTVLVMGGSQGAAGINQLMFRVAGRIAAKGGQVIHLTGERDEQLAAANYMREGLPAYVSPFYDRMEEAYSATDLVVSRAGASSLNEISHFGLASVLVPYPYAADNHQEANAKIFVRQGAAEMAIESESNAETFGLLLENLLMDDSRRKEMGERAAKLQPRDAARRVADEVERICER